jgi:hypothetical protein
MSRTELAPDRSTTANANRKVVAASSTRPGRLCAKPNSLSVPAHSSGDSPNLALAIATARSNNGTARSNSSFCASTFARLTGVRPTSLLLGPRLASSIFKARVRVTPASPNCRRSLCVPHSPGAPRTTWDDSVQACAHRDGISLDQRAALLSRARFSRSASGEGRMPDARSGATEGGARPSRGAARFTSSCPPSYPCGSGAPKF